MGTFRGVLGVEPSHVSSLVKGDADQHIALFTRRQFEFVVHCFACIFGFGVRNDC